MESVLDASTKLWTDEYQREVIDALKNGKHGKTLSNRNFHILKTYNLVSLGGVERVARKKGGKYMITKNEALNVIRLMHQESGHAGERKLIKRFKISMIILHGDWLESTSIDVNVAVRKGRRQKHPLVW